MEFDNIETVKRAVEIDSGVAIVPQETIRQEVANQTLAARADRGRRFLPAAGRDLQEEQGALAGHQAVHRAAERAALRHGGFQPLGVSRRGEDIGRLWWCCGSATARFALWKHTASFLTHERPGPLAGGSPGWACRFASAFPRCADSAGGPPRTVLRRPAASSLSSWLSRAPRCSPIRLCAAPPIWSGAKTFTSWSCPKIGSSSTFWE